MVKGKRIIVTGAGGFIGGEVCSQLTSQGAIVLGLVRKKVCKTEIDQQIHVDLANDALAPILQEFRPDAIIHCAGRIREPRNIEEQIALMRDNYTATANLIDAAQSLSTKPVTVLVSTAAIYAPMEKNQTSIAENHPIGPSGFYGLSKAAAAMLGDICNQRDTLPVRIAVPFNVIGLGQAPTMVPLAFMNQLAENPDAIATGDLSVLRDFVDVRDVAAALIALTGDVSNGRYNIAQGMGVSIGRMLELVCLKRGVEPVVKPAKASIEVLASVANIDKILMETSWTPTIRLDATLHDMLKE